VAPDAVAIEKGLRLVDDVSAVFGVHRPPQPGHTGSPNPGHLPT
jgi:hypothetical protein